MFTLLWEKRLPVNNRTCFLYFPKNDTFFPPAAPCAPVINPQAPNAATGTSLRVCWGLFSDDTVECYQLCYKPVSNERHSDEQAGKGNRETRGHLSPCWQNNWFQSAPGFCCGNQCTFYSSSPCYQHMCHHSSSFWLRQSSAARPAMLPAAAGPVTEAGAAGIKGMGRGQIETGLNKSISFRGAGTTFKHTCMT